MENKWAAEHLAVIRTLMERTAIYRRALAPTNLWTGGVGCLAAVLGIIIGWDHPPAFIIYWMGVSLITMAGAFLIVRRQSLRDQDPFWSPPTRRVTQAMLPSLLVGLLVGTWCIVHGPPDDPATVAWLPAVWMALYGCSLNAAGFFMPRGIRLFGWIFILTGGGLLLMGGQIPTRRIPVFEGSPHALMGATFGGLHIVYGAYLYFTEPRKNEA